MYFFLFVSAGWWSVFIVFPIEDTQHRAFREILPIRQLSAPRMMKNIKLTMKTKLKIGQKRLATVALDITVML